MATEKEIQQAYVKALKTSSCCSNEQIIDGILLPTEAQKQDISFGCVRLDEILKQKLKPTDVIVDFGSGPGHDLIEAAKIVKQGKAIGVDFTPEMHEEVRNKAKQLNLNNIELILSNIEKVDLPDDIADVIISNCVINLANNKSNVLREAFRLLKKGGRLINADVITKRPLMEEIKKDVEKWCSCISGAITQEEYEEILKDEGFSEVKIEMGDKIDVTWEKTEYGVFSALIWAKK